MICIEIKIDIYAWTQNPLFKYYCGISVDVLSLPEISFWKSECWDVCICLSSLFKHKLQTPWRCCQANSMICFSVHDIRVKWVAGGMWKHSLDLIYFQWLSPKMCMHIISISLCLSVSLSLSLSLSLIYIYLLCVSHVLTFTFIQLAYTFKRTSKRELYKST